MTFLSAIKETIDEAKRSGKLMYLYGGRDDSEWRISFRYRSDWLFKAYPGGRKVLSMKGKSLVDKDNK